MRYIYFLIIFLLQFLPDQPQAKEAPTFAIIVPTHFNVTKFTKSDLALIYWRKQLFWDNGQRIHPVNFNSDSEYRNQFSFKLLGSLPSSQTDYWNGMYYHGVSPPQIVNSTEAAILFVSKTAGAISYIDACDVDSRVKAIAWLNAAGNLISEAPEINCQ